MLVSWAKQLPDIDSVVVNPRLRPEGPWGRLGRQLEIGLMDVCYRFTFFPALFIMIRTI